MLVVYVTNIHPWVTERKLYMTFSIFGPIEDVEIIKSYPDHSEQTGLVVFRFDGDASEAARCFNDASIDIGNPVGVRVVSSNEQKGVAACLDSAKDLQKATDESTLVFVKNFDDLLDENKLRTIFEIFGEVKSVSIKKEKGKSKGYGFVDFVEHSCAVEAIKVMDGRKIYGKKVIKVAFALSKEERGQTFSEGAEVKVAVNSNNVLYVKNLPKSFTEEDMRSLFEEYGKIASVSLKTREGASTSVGFVSFEVPDDASHARKHMHGRHFHSEILEVFVKQNSKH